jgi:hypothetical protein
MVFQIVYSPESVHHLAALNKAQQVRAIDEIERQLTHQPTLPTRRRKLLRPNLIARWELRIGDIRVYCGSGARANCFRKSRWEESS